MKRIIKVLLIIILCVCILINIFSAFGISICGIRIYRIGSGSMEPYLKVNDLIIIKEKKEYDINDVITFYDGKNYITHRIVEKNENLITTKGDANNAKDTPIIEENIVGKLVYRFRIFGFFTYLLSKPIFLLLIFIVGVLIIIAIPAKKKRGKHLQ